MFLFASKYFMCERSENYTPDTLTRKNKLKQLIYRKNLNVDGDYAVAVKYHIIPN